MVLAELRRQEECSLAKQVNLFLFTLTSWLLEFSKCVMFICIASSSSLMDSLNLLGIAFISTHFDSSLCSPNFSKLLLKNFFNRRNLFVFSQSEMRLRCRALNAMKYSRRYNESEGH